MMDKPIVNPATLDLQTTSKANAPNVTALTNGVTPLLTMIARLIVNPAIHHPKKTMMMITSHQWANAPNVILKNHGMLN
jgi:hypothetical protein